jgi:NACalpha-BTF3-like transcription factor
MSSESDILCGVCLDSLNPANNSEILLTCQHRFHEACVEPWLTNKGTCPTCRTRIREVAEDSDEELGEEAIEILQNVLAMRESIMEFWERRGLQSERNLEAIVRQVQEEREAQEAERQSRTGIRLEEYASHVRITDETTHEWMYEVDGQTGRSQKNDISLVQTQTEAGFLTCVYAMHQYDNDIVNAIMDITGCI